MGWRVTDLAVESGDICTLRLSDEVWEMEFLFLLAFHGRSAHLSDLHVQGAGANRMGVAALRGLARSAMEYLDVDELRIDGAARTTGAGKGRTPTPLVFRRAGGFGPAA